MEKYLLLRDFLVEKFLSQKFLFYLFYSDILINTRVPIIIGTLINSNLNLQYQKDLIV